MIPEYLINTILKSLDIPALQEKLLADPRVNDAMILATNIRDDFATIKMQNAEILARLDAIQNPVKSNLADMLVSLGDTINHEENKNG